MLAINYNQLHSKINVQAIIAWAVAFGKLDNKEEERECRKEEERHSKEGRRREAKQKKIKRGVKEKS